MSLAEVQLAQTQLLDSVCIAEQTPLSVYVHFPWCVSKCPYCDFNSHTLRGALPDRAYVDSLRLDLENQLHAAPVDISGRAVSSIFLGGGTPSLFPPESLAAVIEMIREALPVENDAEITMEANPATIERGAFKDYAAVGVNRVSLGAQSFSLVALKTLGRIHSPQDTRRAAEELQRAGINNFNLDLMYGLPGQGVSSALEDLKLALELSPTHISHYHLTMEPGTVFAARPPTGLPDEAVTEQLLQACQSLLHEQGFGHYEVSAYARAGCASRHNQIYWTYGDYLGLGAGAHGKLSGPTRSEQGAETPSLGIWRSQRPRDPRRFQREACKSPAWVPVLISERPFEFMLNALRLIEGVPTGLFRARTGLAWASQTMRIEHLLAEGYLQGDPLRMGCLRVSTHGLRFLNNALLPFLP
jgi:putative oxygen-independent coproporphyrinogen III oxidase